jgi:hypothetical protein
MKVSDSPEPGGREELVRVLRVTTGSKISCGNRRSPSGLRDGEGGHQPTFDYLLFLDHLMKVSDSPEPGG